ncbi:MAG TPA: peptide ABC transporter substrate-binding protein, partial [Terriglobia bacterium]|nr:peptide ABC transporter substrate-binding protein [Terriglobia bacterium]
ALNKAVDRRAITDQLLKRGEIPGAHFVPVGFPQYQSPPGPEYDPQEAARLLAEAGYPNGQGFPPVEILFNTLESHRKIAEAIQQMWARTLNIRVTLHNEEWASYLKSTNRLDFDVARRGWVADYPDPSTFIDLMESTNGNNNTGWKNAEYDRLASQAREERNAARRMELMRRAEQILLREAPVIPIYSYSSNNLIKPYVRGFLPSPTEEYPLHKLWIDYAWRANGSAGE